MILRLANLRQVAAAVLLTTLPGATVNAQLTIDQLGGLHNEFLGKYFNSGNAMISSSHYNKQVPGAVTFVCYELGRKGYSCKGCDDQASGVSVATQMVAERYASSPSSFFDNKVALITSKFPLTPDQQSMVSDLRNILCTPGPMSMKQTMITALRTRYASSAPSGAFKEWFGGELSIVEGSCAFWSSPGNPSGGNDPLGFLIGDAVGYLVGWVSAVIDDAGNGNLTPEGESRRISHGLWGAVVGSAVGP
jgi:hypothetical protein